MVTEKTYRSKVKFLRVVLKNADPAATPEWRNRLQQKMTILNDKIEKYERELEA